MKTYPYSPAEGVVWQLTKEEVVANQAARAYRTKYGVSIGFDDNKDRLLERAEISDLWAEAFKARALLIYHQASLQGKIAQIKEAREILQKYAAFKNVHTIGAKAVIDKVEADEVIAKKPLKFLQFILNLKSRLKPNKDEAK